MLKMRTLLFVSLALFAAASCKKKKPPAKPAPRAQATGQVAKPAAKQIHGEAVTYRSGKTVLKGYLAWDKAQKGKRPGILVVHEWWGHNEYARRRARMLAEMGYTALAVDMYGDGKQAGHPKDAQKFMMTIMTNMPEGVRRFRAAKALLEGHPTTDPTKTAAIGYCFGGGVVLHAARIGLDLDAVASFHGGLATKSPAKKGEIKARLLVLNGAADPMVKAAHVAAFKKEMKAAGAKFRLISYPGAQHAFTNPSATALGKKFKLPLAYNESADKKSWEELREFLKSVFGG